MKIKPIEVFRFLKPEYKWIAMHPDKEWLAYQTKPEIWSPSSASKIEIWACNISDIRVSLLAHDIEYNGDWKDSLFKRPKQESIDELCDVCRTAFPEECVAKFKIDISHDVGHFIEYHNDWGELEEYLIYICTNCLCLELCKFTKIK